MKWVPTSAIQKVNENIYKNIFHKLKKILKWNKKGELLYKGKIIKNSNIKKLIKHSLKNDQSKPLGFKVFYKAVSSLHIPIQNKYIKM